MVIRPEPLTREAFKPFGDVLEMAGQTPVIINKGNTRKYSDLSKIRIHDDQHATFSLYRSAPVALPFQILIMERHPLGSQAFMPLHPRPFPVVVALPGPRPGAGDIRVFLSNGRQGVNLHPGVWHHYQLSLECESDYLVVDRSGGTENLETCELLDEVLIQF